MIRVCDAFMGSGKTSASINYMLAHPERKYLYITPYCDETERIRAACPGLHFRVPSNRIKEGGYKKSGHLKMLIEAGENVSITHELFKRADREVTRLLKEQNYCIFIDEVVDIFQKVEISGSDLAMILASGILKREEDENGAYQYYYDPDKNMKQYEGGVFSDFFMYAACRRLDNIPNQDGAPEDNIWYWSFDKEVFVSDLDIFIMTFMFEGSVMAAFLQANNVGYINIGVGKSEDTINSKDPIYEFKEEPQCAPDYVGNLKDLIKIEQSEKLNKIGEKRYSLSNNWYLARKKQDKNKDLGSVKNHVYNFFRHRTDGGAETRLWSTYKSAQEKVKGRGYSNGFLPFTSRATNEYRDRYNLAYTVNIYHDPNIRLYLSDKGAKINDDNYALSTMVQWIWRSAIRDGRSINLYLPSKRMRQILTDWIDESENKYWEMKKSSANERVKLKGQSEEE